MTIMKSVCYGSASYSYSIRRYASQIPPSYMHNPGKYPLVYRTLNEHLDLAVKKYGDREAIVSCQDQKRITFAEIQEKANRLASGLLELGLKKGDRVGIWSPNTINWYISMIGLSKVGITTVALNPAYQISEMAYCINKVNLKGIIASESFKSSNFYEILATILPHLRNYDIKDRSSKKPIVIIDSSKQLQGAHKFDHVLQYGSIPANSFDGPQADDPCNIQFTSGTTGYPKAAVVSHHSVVNNGILSGYKNEFDTGHHRICVQNPFFHSYMIVQGISAGIEHGATLILPNSGYNPLDSLKSIVEEKCTYIFGTPTMYVDLIILQKKLNLPIQNLQYALVAAAPSAPQLYQDMKDILKIETTKNGYGMAEFTCSAFHSLPNESSHHQTEAVGYLQDHTEAKVIDKYGNVVPMGTPGELCLRGYQTMQCYHDDDEKTKEILSYDRWYKTGDKFILYEDGYGQIVGRLKDMIIRGGENIFPKEIEGLLVNHPDIIEAQVIGVPDERMGEELCAYIRTVQGKIVTQNMIKDFFRGKIAHYKIPRYVKVVRSYPTTATGKIQKFKLREMFISNNLLEVEENTN